MNNGFYIAIEGNIGSGKTTLARLLAPRLNARLILEEYEDNPFLKGFYKDPERYGFSVEMSFLADRYHQLREKLSESDLFQPNVVADYAPFKSLIFAQNNLGQHEFKLYRDFWNMSLGRLTQPDLVLYLAKPTEDLQRNIKKRGRRYEQKIQDEYLDKLGIRYTEFFRMHQEVKTMRVDTKQLDFLAVPSNCDKIVEMIWQALEDTKRENNKKFKVK